MTRLARASWMVLALLIIVTAPASAESPDEVFSFANHLKRDGLNEAAAQQFLRFARENPTDGRAPEALLSAADCLNASGGTEQAVTVLEAIVSTYPDHPEQCRVQVQLGRLYAKLDRYDEADRTFTRVAVTMPDCALVPDALLGKGEALMAQKNFAAASEVLRTVVESHVESKAAPRAAYSRAVCLVRLGRNAEALAEFERVVTRFPGDPLAGFAALEAARMQAARGEVERAVALYDRAKGFGTKVFYEPAGREGGELLAAAGQPKRALAWFEELLGQQDVDDRSAIYVLAVEAAYAAGDDGAVARLSDDYATRYPETFAPQMAYTRARSALRTGRHAQALEEANRIEQIAVGTEWARAAPRLRGGAYLGMGEPARAIDELSLFVAISSDSAARCDVLKEIAQVGFTAARDTTAALDALERLLDVERRALPGEMLSVALAYEGAGRFGDAARHHRDLAARHPLSEEAAEAEARLAFLDEFAVTDYAAAVAALDGRISEIAGAGAKGLLLLVEARVEVLKDFEGALALCERIEKGTKVDETRTHATYLRGLCHAKMARRALGARGGKDAAKTARDHAKRADAAWKDLSGGGSPWAVAAAFERALLEADLDRVDVAAAEALMNAHPEAPESARLAERLGDHFAESASNEDLARAAAFYERAARARPDSPALSLKLATARARAGRCEEALPELERIARDQRSRTGLRASYEAGACLRELKRPREAAPYFDRVAQRDPNGNFGTGAMLQAGDCFYLQRDFEGALDRYARAGRAAPSEARRWEAGYRAGLALRGLGRDADALARFQACVASDQGGASRPRAYQNAVETAGALGDGDRQVALIETWITEFRPEESAESAAAAATLARLYLERDQAKEALALAQRLARAGDKDAAEPRALEAMALYRLGRTGDADQARARVVTLAGAESPLVQEIGVEAARYHYDAKRFAEAAAAVRPFAESCSGEGACEGARYLYALALFGAQQMEKGSAVAQSFFRDYPLSPRTSTLHLRMGNVLAASGRPNEAVIHYREAVETTRDDATAFDALKNLGLTYHKMERWRDAEQVWYQVLSRYGDRPYATEAALNVGRCRMERGDYAGAIDAYEKSLPLLQGEDRARAFYWMGQSYEQLGDYQSAVVEYLKVPYLSSAGGMWVVTAQLQAAQCYARIERPEAAREIYEKVIRAHGAGSSWGKLAQKGLDALRAPSGEGSGGSGP